MAKKYNIQIECWFPLGGRDSHGEILRDPVINEIARAHGKSAAHSVGYRLTSTPSNPPKSIL
jgi:diketogulonate reductase-like aldo/keto reductase